MATKNLHAFGIWLASLRRRRGLSQAQLVLQVNERAGKTVIGLRTIGRWENGENEPYLSELAPVVDCLGGSIEEATALIVGGAKPQQKAA